MEGSLLGEGGTLNRRSGGGPMNDSDQTPEEIPENKLRLFLAAFRRGLVRLLVIVIVIGALVGVVYYGVPALYRWFINPVERNTDRLDKFQSSQEAENEQLAGRIDDLQLYLE